VSAITQTVGDMICLPERQLRAPGADLQGTQLRARGRALSHIGALL